MSLSKEGAIEEVFVSPEQRMRTLFKETYEDNINKGLYDQRDVEKFNTNDAFTRAYLPNYLKNIDRALPRVHGSFAWRKDIGINDLTVNSFEPWVWQKGVVYYHNRDKDGRKILYMRLQNHEKNVNLLPLMQKLAAYLLEQSFRENPEDTITVLLDADGAGLANINIELAKYIDRCFRFYYPRMLGYMLVYSMPWLFNAAWKIIKNWLPKAAVERIKFCSKSDIQLFIRENQLLEHMGGTDKFVYNGLPPENEIAEEYDSPDTGASEEEVTVQSVSSSAAT